MVTLKKLLYFPTLGYLIGEDEARDMGWDKEYPWQVVPRKAKVYQL